MRSWNSLIFSIHCYKTSLCLPLKSKLLDQIHHLKMFNHFEKFYSNYSFITIRLVMPKTHALKVGQWTLGGLDSLSPACPQVLWILNLYLRPINKFLKKAISFMDSCRRGDLHLISITFLFLASGCQMSIYKISNFKFMNF